MKSVGECKSSCPKRKFQSRVVYNIIYTICNSCSVCKAHNSTCNFNGFDGTCIDGKCACKSGYFGNLCQYCEVSENKKCMVVDNRIDEVDSITGQGVLCSCK